MAHFYEVAAGIAGAGAVFPNVQSGGTLSFPSIVYQAVGHDVISTIDRGPQQIGTAIRFEARARGYGAAVNLSERIVRALRAAGRMRSLLSLLDLFDDELGIHRRIRSVMVA